MWKRLEKDILVLTQPGCPHHGSSESYKDCDFSGCPLEPAGWHCRVSISGRILNAPLESWRALPAVPETAALFCTSMTVGFDISREMKFLLQ